jgi:hypothetical protein
MIMPSIPTDLFRTLAKAKTDQQLDRVIETYVIATEITSQLRVRWRAEQRELNPVVNLMDRIPELLVKHRARRVKDGLVERERSQPNAEAQADEKHRYWEFSVLADLINKGLERTKVLTKLVVELDWVPVGCHARLEPGPSDLLGACWLQLAEAARGLANQNPEQGCEQCGAKFTPRRKSSAGAPVRFCSDKCRMANAYANRTK